MFIGRAQPELELGPGEPLTIARLAASACEQPDHHHVKPSYGAPPAAVTIAATACICYLVSPRWRDSGECDAISHLCHWSGRRPKSHGPMPGLPKPVTTAAQSSALRPSTSSSLCLVGGLLICLAYSNCFLRPKCYSV